MLHLGAVGASVATSDVTGCRPITGGGLSLYWGRETYAGHDLAGTLNDSRVYSRALSATEIAQLASTHAAPDITSGLIHWWKFDEAPGATTAVDTVGGANAPLSGTAAFTTSGYFNNGLNLPDDTTPKAVTVTTPADMLGQSKLTESMWFKLATPGSWVQAY